MKFRNLVRCAILGLFALAATRALAQSGPSAPHLEKRGAATQLIVDGKPFLVLGGELHNSSSSSLDYMKPIWPRLVKMNLNAVLAVVSWEQIEPTEGKFDFTVVDGLLDGARQHNLRIVLLWFGSWKNGTSRYEADWVKADQARFPRVANKAGKTLEILSTLGEATREADAKAFAALMRHVREVDAAQRTVIMIQMQNEVGVLGDSRDRSPAANAAFAGPVPEELMNYLTRHKATLLPELRKTWDAAGGKTSGSWNEVFGHGPAADEIFMQWNYARYCNRVSEAGKAEYPLPTFVNTWIVQPEDKGPGDYPSGGPQTHGHDIWRAGAPKIDILAPDIYLPDFPGILAKYSRSGNPVFIPESRGDAGGAANAFCAFGQFNAIGYSPFGIDDAGRLLALRPEPGQAAPANIEDMPLPRCYATLSQLAPLILEHQAAGSIGAAWLTKGKQTQKLSLGNYTVTFDLRRNYRNPKQVPALGYGIAIATGPDEYVVSGSDVQVTFTPKTPGPAIAGLSLVEEGVYKDGAWTPGRRLNGDEVQLRYDLSKAAAEGQSGAGLKFGPGGPTIQRVKLYRYH